jgi:hypothetical protein
LNQAGKPPREIDVDASRLRTGEIVAGIGGFALFVFLFFDWFGGGPEVSGNVLSGTASISHPGISGWNALVDLPGFLIMLSGFSGMALAALAGAGQRLNIPVRRGAITALLGALAVLLILWRMVAGTPTLKIGIFLGLGAAIAITWGALLALAEDGFEPLVAVPGGRTRAASSASAPATTTTAGGSAPAAKPPKRASSSGGSASRKRSTASKRSSAKRSTTNRSTAKRSTTKKKSSSSGSRSSSTRSRSSSSRKKSTGSKSSGGKRSSSRKK